MKQVDIITSEMHQIHGANRVTEKLIIGREIFKTNGFCLRFLISQDGVMNCNEYEKSSLGFLSDTAKAKAGIVSYLKKLPFYKSYFIQKILLENLISENKKVVDYYSHIEEKPDLIIFQDPYTAYVFLSEFGNGIPSIFISHAASDPLEQLLMNRPEIAGTKEENRIRELFQYVFSSVSKVVTISGRSQDYMLENYSMMCPCIINGIEDIVPNHNKWSDKDHKLHIVILASVQYRKGQDIAIEALARLPLKKRERIMLHIVGNGQGYFDIKELVEKYRLNACVIMHGAISEVNHILCSMDVFLLPSRADTVPIAIIEAMRSELPIFASNVGEIPKMLEGCGYGFEANVDSVYKIYCDLLNNEFDLKIMGINSRKKYLSDYNLTSMISKYSIVLKKLKIEEQ